jgi:hypothetical protein
MIKDAEDTLDGFAIRRKLRPFSNVASGIFGGCAPARDQIAPARRRRRWCA